MTGQRESERVTYRRKVIFGPSDSPGCLGYANDLSATGIFIMTSKTFSLGTVLSLVINDDGKISKSKGIVTWLMSDGDQFGRDARSGLGVRFLEMSNGLKNSYHQLHAA